MSVLFYRRPDYYRQPRGPINSSDCARYVERAKSSERAVPAGLGFNDVITNKALPPCSLHDFMDYLVYIEHNAENLQFYLWYKEYVQRFNALSENEKTLCAEWTPVMADVPDLSTKFLKAPGNSQNKRDTITSIMTDGYESKDATFFEDTWRTQTSDAFVGVPKDDQHAVAPSITAVQPLQNKKASEITTQACLKWQPFTIQPMRDEINRIVRHYIAFTAPRELNLSHKDRALCLHALQHTTHPSALFPAINIAEATLRGQSHPNFIRWSICNGNKPRVFFVRTMGVCNIISGFLIALLLTLSNSSRWWRIVAAVEWFLGFSTLIAAYKGLCVILHKSNVRNLRPWELHVDELEEEVTHPAGPSSAASACRNDHTENEDGIQCVANAARSTMNMQPFGPKNSFEDCNWYGKYERRPLLSKVFEKSVWTQDANLRILQDRIVRGANIWAVVVTVPLTVAFVALPKGGFF